jgi:hypothetical protein
MKRENPTGLINGKMTQRAIAKSEITNGFFLTVFDIRSEIMIIVSYR